MSCHYCGADERETRPYGPNGAPICYPCMTADPARERAAADAFRALFDIAGPVVLIGELNGPRPATADDLAPRAPKAR